MHKPITQNYATENLELKERIAELESDIGALKKENAELKRLISQKPTEVEQVRFHRSGIKFRCGPSTGGQRLPFCPSDDQPAISFSEKGINQFRIGCSRRCGWVSAAFEEDIPGLVHEIQNATA